MTGRESGSCHCSSSCPETARRGWIPIVLVVSLLVSVPVMASVGQPVSGETSAVPGSVSPAVAGEEPTRTQSGTISQRVIEATGTQTVLVYFDSRKRLPAQRVTVEQLKQRMERAQAPLNEYAATTDGVTVINNFWLGNVAVVEIDHDRTSVRELARIDGVRHVGPNFEVTIERNTALETVGTTPAVRRTVPGRLGLADSLSAASATDVTYGLDQINAPEVWSEYNTKGGGVSVAVLDTGVDDGHPAISLSRWNDWDSQGNVRNTSPLDYDDQRSPGGHGTHTSGTVSGDDAGGIHIGVAPNVTLFHGAVLTDCTSSGCTGTGAQITAGMQWAVDKDVDILSMSLGTGGYSSGYISLVRDAEKAGTLVVASIGNDGEGTSGSPGNVYDTLSVGASDNNRDIASFSSGEQIDTSSAWGSNAPSEWPEQYIVPRVSAPGARVNSSVPGGGYADKWGTSMAAPHVAGAAALVQAGTDRDLSVSTIEDALVDTAVHPSGDVQDNRYGHGIIDVKAALDSLVSSKSATFTVQLSGTNDPVTAGETLSVDATVTNSGNASGTQTVELVVGGTVRDSTGLSLAAGTSQSVTLNWTTGDGDAGTYTGTVRSQNDSDSTSLTVHKPATFAVSNLDPENATVETGEKFNVSATVTNTGDVSGNQTVELRLEPDANAVRNRSISLNAGAKTTVTFTDVSILTAGRYNHTIATADSKMSGDLSVSGVAEFEVSNLRPSSGTVEAGERFEVNATISNTGSGAGNQTIELRLEPNGSAVARQTVSLAAGSQTTVRYRNVSVDTAGTYNHTVATLTDRKSGTLTVTQSATFAVSGLQVINEYEIQNGGTIPDNQAVQKENITVQATLTNTGSTAGSTDISYELGEGTLTETVAVNDLAAGNSTTVYVDIQLGTDLTAGSYTHGFDVVGGDSNVSGTLGLYEPGDVNHANGVGPGDSTLVQQAIVGIDLSTYNPAAADLNQDDTVGPGDVTRLQQLIVGSFTPPSMQTKLLDSGTN